MRNHYLHNYDRFKRVRYIAAKRGFSGLCYRAYCEQIHRINLFDRCFPADKEFNLKEHFEYVWALLKKNHSYQIVLKFNPETAIQVTKAQWHKTQKIIYNKDGSIIVKFELDGLNEITWWILDYGNRVKVLAPGLLQEIIFRIKQKSKCK